MKIKKYIEEFLSYTIGFSQVYLQQDNKLMWIIVETFSQFQKVAIIFMDPIILQIIQNKTSIKNTSVIDNPYSLFDSLVKTAIPTVYVISNISLNVLIGISVVLSIIVYCPFWINAQQLKWEQLEFSRIKYKTRVQEGQNNLNHSINLLNRSYNMHNFIEHFLQKQLMGSSGNSSWSASERKLQSKILNIFPHVATTPLIYWVTLSLLIAFHVDMSSTQLTLLTISNVIICIGTHALWVFSLSCQRTYFINDTNHLRLVQSFWFNSSQVLKVIPIVIQLIHFAKILQMPQSNEYGYQIEMLVILLILIGDLVDNYVSYPFVMQYKQNTILLLLPFCIMITVLKIGELDYNNLISVSLFSVPILSKFLIEGQQVLNNKILVSSLYKERIKSRTPIRSTSFLVQGEEQPFVIEREQNIQRDVQLQFLQNQEFRYFIHYLRLIDLMQINDQQSFERESAKINYSKSKFIISVIVLLKSHISQCDNVYCYCKGFRGEKRRIIERNFHTINMKIYSDFDKYNLLIQVDLVRRYIRYYTKLIFELEKNKSNLNYAKISQLITYLSQSEESYQTLLLIMEYKSKHQQSSIISNVVLTLMTSYTKYQILYSQQFYINFIEIETALQYKDYRMTEVRQDKIIDMIFNNLKSKAELMKKLSNNKFNYQEMQNLIEQQLNVNQKTMDFIETFNEFSNSRTSLLLYMLFVFEVTNNFDKFLKLRNLLKTKSFKFYEYPLNMRNNNNSSYEACYIKANIARHAKKGKINRGEIIQYSNNTPELFGYSQRDFAENVVTIHQLVTNNLSIYHDQLIEIFLLTNRPSILRKKRPLLVLRQNKDLMFAEMFVDLCFSVTQDTFPVYCFLRKLSSTGEYENIRGHLVLNDQLRVEGMSTMALEEFKLLGNKRYLQKRISKFIPQWKRYYDRLILQYDQYQQSENQKKRQGSISNKIDYNQSELLLNHFSFFADNVVFRIIRPQQNNQIDTYIVECNFQMTIGNIHGNEYKSFLIQFSKINLVEQNGSKVISTYDFNSSNANEDENPEITVVINHSCSSVPFVDDERNDSQISLDQYQFKMKSHFQSPNDSKGELIFTQRAPQKSLLELDSEKPMQIQNKQQQFYQSSKAKKSEYDEIDEDDNQLINKTDHELKLNTNSTSVQNTQVTNLISKTQLFSKFSRKSYLPRLIYIILLLDFVVLNIGIILNTINFSQLNDNLSGKSSLFGMLEAFVTTEYTNNLVIAINLQYNFQDNQTSRERLQDILKVNSDDYVERYQQLLHDSLVQQTLSGIYLMYFDSQYKEAYNLSAWNEFFAVSYMQKGLKSYSFDQSQNYQFNLSLYTLIEQYRLHSEAYSQIQTQFQISAVQDYERFMTNTENLLIIYVISQLIFGLFYGVAYFSLRNLQIRIIRTSEQISIQSLQSEQFRCEHLVSTYPKSNDLDLHGYPFHIRDKIVQTLQLNNAQASRFTLKFKANQNNNEHKKQLVITDEVPILERFIFLTSMVTLVLFFIYIVSLYIVNDSEFNSIQQEFTLYLQQISTVQKFATVVFMDTILVNQDTLTNNSTYYDQRLIDQYSQQMHLDSGYLVAMSNEFVFGQTNQAFNLLEQLSQNVCLLIDNNDDCPTLIDGKLQAGGIYAITYYIGIVSDNQGLNYDQSSVHQYTIGEIIAFQYLMEAMRNIVSNTREQIYNEIQNIISARLALFIIFNVLLILLQLIQSILTQRNIRHRLYVPRQLPYVLPPQALFGEDSFMKTLVFIQKTYDNIFHY